MTTAFNRSICSALAAAITCAAIATASAETPLQLRWKDLVPKQTTLPNPFTGLTDDQRYELGNVARIRGLIAAGRLKDDPETREEGRKLEEKLNAQGVAVDELLAKYKTFKAKVVAQRSSIDPALQDKDVRVPGYLLPLMFDEAGVNEFLLVPYVGACIHTPPPPRNQIIFVRTATPFKVNGLYTPVWVTGRMSTKPVTNELSYVDGRRQIEAGYSIADAEIANYTR